MCHIIHLIFLWYLFFYCTPITFISVPSQFTIIMIASSQKWELPTDLYHYYHYYYHCQLYLRTSDILKILGYCHQCQLLPTTETLCITKICQGYMSTLVGHRQYETIMTKVPSSSLWHCNTQFYWRVQKI